MTAALWVAIGVGVLATAAQLLDGYWTRKQVRQAELFRKDASLGLRPPDSPPWAWIKRNLVILITLIAGVFAPIGGIIFQLGHDHPMTRSDVFFTAYYFGTIAFTLSVRFTHSIVDRLLDIIKTLSDTDAALREAISLIDQKAALELQLAMSSTEQKALELQLRTAPPGSTAANAAVPANPPTHDPPRTR
jgi:hypothetical protein